MATLNHKEPDRVPVDVWGTASRICNDLFLIIAEDQDWKELGSCVKASRSGDYVDDRLASNVKLNFQKPDKIRFIKPGELPLCIHMMDEQFLRTPKISNNGRWMIRMVVPKLYSALTNTKII
jgi:hypothetical protein